MYSIYYQYIYFFSLVLHLFLELRKISLFHYYRSLWGEHISSLPPCLIPRVPDTLNFFLLYSMYIHAISPSTFTFIEYWCCMHEHNNSYLSGIHDFEWMMSTLNVTVTQLIVLHVCSIFRMMYFLVVPAWFKKKVEWHTCTEWWFYGWK